MKDGNHEERHLSNDASGHRVADSSNTLGENHGPDAGLTSNRRNQPSSSSSSSAPRDPSNSIRTPQAEAAAGSLPPVDVVVVGQQQAGAAEGENMEGSGGLNASASQQQQQQQKDGYLVVVAVKSRPDTAASKQREGAIASASEPQRHEEHEEETGETNRDTEAFEASSASRARAQRGGTERGEAVPSPPAFRHRGDVEGRDHEKEGEAQLPMPPSPKAHQQREEPSPPSSSQNSRLHTSHSPSSPPYGVDFQTAEELAPSPPSESSQGKRREGSDDEAVEHSTRGHLQETEKTARKTGTTSSHSSQKQHGALAVTPPGSPPASHPNRENEVDAGAASACHEHHHGDHRAGPHSHRQSERQTSSSPSASPKTEHSRHGLNEQQRHRDVEADEQSARRRHQGDTDEPVRGTGATSNTAAHRHHGHTAQAVTPPGSPPASRPNRDNEVDAGKASACHDYHQGDHRAGPHSHRQSERQAPSSPSPSASPKPEGPGHGLEERPRHGEEKAEKHSARRPHRETEKTSGATGDASSAASRKHHGALAVTPPGSPPGSHPDRDNEVDAGKASACHEYHHGDHRAGPHSHRQSEGQTRRPPSSPSASPPTPETRGTHHRHGEKEAGEQSARMHHRETGEPRRATGATSASAGHDTQPRRRAQAVTPPGSPPASHPNRENEVDAGKASACHDYHSGDHRAGPHSHRQSERQISPSASSPSPEPKKTHHRHAEEEADEQSAGRHHGDTDEPARKTSATSNTAAHRHHGHTAQAVTPPGSPPPSHPNRENEVDAGKASACHDYHQGDHRAGPHSHRHSERQASSSPSPSASPSTEGPQRELEERPRHGEEKAEKHSARRPHRETEKTSGATGDASSAASRKHHGALAVTPPNSPPGSHPNRDNEVDAGKASACHEYHHGDHRAGPHSHRQSEGQTRRPSSSPSASSPSPQTKGTHHRHGEEGADEQSERRHHRQTEPRKATAATSASAGHETQPRRRAQAVTPPGSPPASHPNRENEVDAGKASACHDYHSGDHRAGPHSHRQSERQISPSASSPSPEPKKTHHRHAEEEADEQSERRHHRERDEPRRATGATSNTAAHRHRGHTAQAVTPPGSPPPSHPSRENEVDAGKASACHDYHQGDHRAGPHSHRQSERQESSSPSPSASPKTEGPGHGLDGRRRHDEDEVDEQPFDASRVSNGFQRETSPSAPSPSQRGRSPPTRTQLANGYPPPESNPQLRGHDVEASHADGRDRGVVEGGESRTSREEAHQNGTGLQQSSSHHQEGGERRRHQHGREDGEAACTTCSSGPHAHRHHQEATHGEPATPPSPPPTATNEEGSRQAGSPSACSGGHPSNEVHNGLVFSSHDVEAEFRHVLRENLAHRADQARGERAGEEGVDATPATLPRSHAEGGRGEEAQLISNGVAPSHHREEQQRNRGGEVHANGLAHPDNYDPEYQARVGAAAAAAAAEAAATAAATAPRAGVYRGEGDEGAGSGSSSHYATRQEGETTGPVRSLQGLREESESLSASREEDDRSSSSPSPLAHPESGREEDDQVHESSPPLADHEDSDKRETSVSASSLFPSPPQGKTQDQKSPAGEAWTEGSEKQQTPKLSASSPTHREKDRRDASSEKSSSPDRAAEPHKGRKVQGPSPPPPGRREEKEGGATASPSPPRDVEDQKKTQASRQGGAEPSKKRRSPSSSPSVTRKGLDREVQGPSPPPHWRRKEGEEASSRSPSPSLNRHDATPSSEARAKKTAESLRGARQPSSSSSPSPSEGKRGDPSGIPSPAAVHRSREKDEKQAVASASPADRGRRASKGQTKEQGKSSVSSSSPSPSSGHKREGAQGPSRPPHSSRHGGQEERRPPLSSPSPSPHGAHQSGYQQHDEAKPSDFFESRLAAKKRGGEAHKEASTEEPSSPVAKHPEPTQGRQLSSSSPSPDREGAGEKIQGPSPPPSSGKPREGKQVVSSSSPSPSLPRHAGEKTSGVTGRHDKQREDDKPGDSTFFSDFLASRREKGGADAQGGESQLAARRTEEKNQAAPSSQASAFKHRASANDKGPSTASRPPAETGVQGPSAHSSMGSKQAKDKEVSPSPPPQRNKDKAVSSPSPSVDDRKAQGESAPSQRGRGPHKKAQGTTLPPVDQGRENEVEGDASSTVSSPSASPSPREAPSKHSKQSAEDKPSTSSFIGPKKKEEVHEDRKSSGGSLSPSPSPGHKGKHEKKESLIPLSSKRQGSPSASPAHAGKEKSEQKPSPSLEKHREAAHASHSSSPSLSPPPSGTHKGKAASKKKEASSSSSSSKDRKPSPPSTSSSSSSQRKEEKGEREKGERKEASPEPTPEEIARRGLVNDAFAEMRAGTDALKHVTYAAASDVSERVRMRAQEALHWAQEKREETGDVLGEAWRETKKTGVAARKQVADFINPE
ncbi:hypothetical protein Emag_002316 [Eimeria magna]